jgi:hypothetical protein
MYSGEGDTLVVKRKIEREREEKESIHTIFFKNK